VDILLDPDARPMSRASKFWAEPIAWMALGRKGGTVEQTVSEEAREEIKMKLSRFVRARWFQPPFGGEIFCRLIYDALELMEQSPAGSKLLPPGQPLDLFVTVTDFAGHPERLSLHSPAEALEMEHRITISFQSNGLTAGPIAERPELIFAGRATASFPGAFPPFTVRELDKMLRSRSLPWPGKQNFLKRILPTQYAKGVAEDVVLIDGSVLANAPFAQAIGALKNRPAKREVDRRFVYIDPRPDLDLVKSDRAQERLRAVQAMEKGGLPGFFSTIFGAISNIPREQPIRDNLNAIEGRSNRILQMRRITDSLREEVETTVETLLGRTFFLDRPTAARLAAWRRKARLRAAKLAGFSYAAYGHLKLSNILDDVANTVMRAMGQQGKAASVDLKQALWDEMQNRAAGSRHARKPTYGNRDLADFLHDQDLGYRIRRLRLMARRLAEEFDATPAADIAPIEAMHDAIYDSLSHYIERETLAYLGPEFEAAAKEALQRPAHLLDTLARCRNLSSADSYVDQKISAALSGLPKRAQRTMLLAFMGFPFYDIATLPLLQGEGLDEFDPIKVDRISPEDAQTIRTGGVSATLKGIEFNNFGAFFSRSYRENDYLWGRLHGAERMVDLVLSTLPDAQQPGEAQIRHFKKQAFQAILDEENDRLMKVQPLIASLREEIGRI
jgi:patatin-related protein